MVLFGLVSRLAPDPAYVSCELEYPSAVGAEWGERVHQVGDEIREGDEAAWAPWREEAGIRGVDGGWGSGWN